MLFHPPILYLGYVGFTVPFAFAIAALITGRVGEGWLMETRRWALFAWGFLTIGILLGGWWSYEVLGWSGVWAWDPVENASLLPWLTGTAYIHSVLVQERRGMLRVWNLSLLVATFALTILGTFLTRSGVINSVHAFAAGQVDGYLLGFFGLVVVVSLALIAWRGDRLRSPGAIDSPVSRGGRVPRQQRGVHGVRVRRAAGHGVPADRRGAAGPPHRRRGAVLRSALDADRHRPAVPDGRRAGAAVAQGVDRAAARPVVLAGVVRCRARSASPSWSAPTGGLRSSPSGSPGSPPAPALRQLVLATRRQGWRGLVGRANGGMIVHLGVIMIAVALAASNSYTHSATITLQVGEARAWGGHTFELVRITQEVDDRASVVRADVLLDGDKIYAPAITKYLRLGTDIATPSVRTGLTERRLPDDRPSAVAPTPTDREVTLRCSSSRWSCGCGSAAR